jgi:hypothetical protein
MVEQGGRLFVGLAEVEDGWWRRRSMIDNMLVTGLGNFGMLVLGNAEGRMGSGPGYVGPIVWCG